MAQPALTGWDRSAFEDMRSRLHARHDAALAPRTFTLDVANRPSARGLTRTLTLRVAGETHRWTLTTRTWSGTLVQDLPLPEAERAASATLTATPCG